ncbi:DUF2267 domain-containing protein [Halobacteriales archaeon QS_4_69_34]|nr:MAG: DUF2267 domain-containing protein [Halobacteriales archaeon QS_4_69_34]
MDDDQFFSGIESRADLKSRDEAAAAAEATLRVLGERIARGQARDLADSLPADLGDALTASGDEQADEFPPGEFVERVRDYEREQIAEIDVTATQLHVQVVLESLAGSVDGGTWNDTRTQLPSEYSRLYETG